MQHANIHLKAKTSILALLSCFHLFSDVYARDYFNPALVELGAPGKQIVDLSLFESTGGQAPGIYRVDIYLNDNKVATKNVEFKSLSDGKGGSRLTPCLSVSELQEWGVIVNKHPGLGSLEEKCANISVIPQASSDFRFSQQQLILSIPQSSVKNSVRGWVDPKYWDDGIPAFLLNYSMSGSNSEAKQASGSSSNGQYVNLRPGINIGPWRIRNYTTWVRSSTDGRNGTTDSHWNTVYTNATRGINSLKGQLTLGDSTTPSDLFDSIPFRGVQLASDDSMLPDSMKGYAPVVRGTAKTNAQVTIKQNGYLIYQTYVSPGSFEINDMYPTGSAGDLNVMIKESDGTEQHIIIPFASLPVLQRERHLKYSITSGVYRAYDNSIDKTPLSQGSLIYGLPLGLTLYGGGQFSSKFQSLATGIGKNIGVLGALSADVTQAWSSQKDKEKESGQSWRVRYSKNFLQTGTNFTVAGYRYATSGYWSMTEVLDSYHRGMFYVLQERRRNRAELTLSQNLWENGGGLAVTLVREDYWNTGRRLESYGLNYNNSWKGVSYGISYTYNSNSSVSYNGEVSNGRIYNRDQVFAANFTIPFNALFDSKSQSYATYALNSTKNGSTTNNLSVGGTLLEDDNLSWSINEGYGSRGQGSSGGVSANWRATYGTLNAGYAYDRNADRFNFGGQGGVIVHSKGVTFGQSLGDTITLIEAPGASSIDVQGQTGVKTDWRGYAIVPYVSPYRKNNLALNTETFGDDVDVKITTQTVIPTRGAVTKATYDTSVGTRAIATLVKANGDFVPFGAVVSSGGGAKDIQGFIVGDGGQVYLTGLDTRGELIARWGDSGADQCTIKYTLPHARAGIVKTQQKCL